MHVSVGTCEGAHASMGTYTGALWVWVHMWVYVHVWVWVHM